VARGRKIQVGEKLAGRPRQQASSAASLPREDMPYLPDGNTIDFVS